MPTRLPRPAPTRARTRRRSYSQREANLKSVFTPLHQDTGRIADKSPADLSSHLRTLPNGDSSRHLISYHAHKDLGILRVPEESVCRLVHRPLSFLSRRWTWWTRAARVKTGLTTFYTTLHDRFLQSMPYPLGYTPSGRRRHARAVTPFHGSPKGQGPLFHR